MNKSVIAFVIIVCLLAMPVAFAATELTVSTDKPVYKLGDIARIYGFSAKQAFEEESVVIEIRDSDNNIIWVDSARIINNSYSISYLLANVKPGSYAAYALQNNETASTRFDVTGEIADIVISTNLSEGYLYYTNREPVLVEPPSAGSVNILIDSAIAGQNLFQGTVIAGTHEILFGELAGYNKPLSSKINFTKGTGYTIIGTYARTPVNLTIETQPAGGAVKIETYNERVASVSTPVTLELISGRYKLTFYNMTGYKAQEPISIEITNNMNIVANYTPSTEPAKPLPEPSPGPSGTSPGSSTPPAVISPEKKCLPCPHTKTSDCANEQQTITTYHCSVDTNYQCVATTSVQDCCKCPEPSETDCANNLRTHVSYICDKSTNYNITERSEAKYECKKKEETIQCVTPIKPKEEIKEAVEEKPASTTLPATDILLILVTAAIVSILLMIFGFSIKRRKKIFEKIYEKIPWNCRRFFIGVLIIIIALIICTVIYSNPDILGPAGKTYVGKPVKEVPSPLIFPALDLSLLLPILLAVVIGAVFVALGIRFGIFKKLRRGKCDICGRKPFLQYPCNCGRTVCYNCAREIKERVYCKYCADKIAESRSDEAKFKITEHKINERKITERSEMYTKKSRSDFTNDKDKSKTKR